MRPRVVRVIRVVSSRVFGVCACGSEIMYFSDYGVKCRSCYRLYGTWSDNGFNGHRESRFRFRPNYIPEEYSSKLVDIVQDSKATKYPIVPYRKGELMLTCKQIEERTEQKD